MKFSEVKSRILESFSELAEEAGYKVRKGDFSLTKKTKEKEVSLYFTKNSWYDEVQLMPSVECYIYNINETLLKAGDTKQAKYPLRAFFMNIKELKDWYELGKVDWEKFNRSDGDKYIIMEYTMDFDIEYTSREVQNLFRRYGLKYFDEYASVEGVDKLFNTIIEEDSVHHSLPSRSLVGLAAAKLNGNPHYSEVSEQYSSLINQFKAEMNEEDVERFLKVKKYLG